MLGLIDKKGNEQFERISQFKEYVLDIAKNKLMKIQILRLILNLKRKVDLLNG